MTQNTNYQWIKPGQGPLNLYDGASSRTIDQDIIQKDKVTGFDLVLRAAAASLECLQDVWPEPTPMTILCGPGNNGADGLALGKLATEQALSVRLILIANKNQLGHESKLALAALEQAAIPLTCFEPSDPNLATAIAKINTRLWVDALFGTGLNRALNQEHMALVHAINQHPAPTLSLDIPSGIHADTGTVLGKAIDAQICISFITLKAGLFRDAGKAHTGKLALATLNTDTRRAQRFQARAQRIHFTPPFRPKRRADFHKGSCGNLVCIGGNQGMAGAILMAAQAALHVGVGKIFVATPKQNHAMFLSAQPELLMLDTQNTKVMTETLASASGVLIGPGLGQDAWAMAQMKRIEALNVPILMDADALNLIAAPTPAISQAKLQQLNLVLTPHPGEAKGLFHAFAQTQQNNFEPFAAATTLAKALKATMVLKGAGTLITIHDEEKNQTHTHLCDSGNSGMAKGGMGDVLAGCIAGLLAQSDLDHLSAVKLGVWLHSTAADSMGKQVGIYNLLPSKLPEYIGALLGTAQSKPDHDALPLQRTTHP